MPTHLAEGDPAPDFAATDATGKTHQLKDYRGKKLVLYFYPADDTPVCTAQACNLRDNWAALKATGVHVLGISPNDADSHVRFAKKFDLPFPLLADTDKIMIDAYGVWGEKNMYGNKIVGLLRTTFVIDEQGVIRHIIRRPRSKVHAEEILKKLER